jgi:hypothetical protein
LIIWLTAPGVTHSSCAASFTDRWRAAASKARNALSGGSREELISEEFNNLVFLIQIE